MTIKLYWWRGEGALCTTKQNFGDYLSPLLVEMVSGRKVEYAEPQNADMIAIGSILSRERKAKRWLMKRRLHIWGSGTDKSTRNFSERHFYHAVRGSITKSQIAGKNNPPVLGDPGLLADRWWGGRPKPVKKYRLGVVPHFVDQQNKRLDELLRLDSTKLINVLSPVEDVIREIQKCDFILSSSLHGLIIADAFAIPNRRMPLSSGVISELKFDDYYSAFDLASPPPALPDAVCRLRWEHPLFTAPYDRPGIEKVKDGLIEAFPDF